MKLFLEEFIKNKISVSIVVFILFQQLSFSQQVTGPTNVEEYNTYRYEYNDYLSYGYPTWNVYGGTVVSSGNTGTLYYANVQWGAAGQASVIFQDKTRIKGELYLTISPGASAPTISPDQNYILTTTPRVATTNAGSLTNSDKMEAINFFDGLGRPIQSIGIRGGGNSEDIITYIGYDDFGRQSKEYLPYSSSTDIGVFRTDSQDATNNYYDAAKYEPDFPSVSVEDINAFSEKELEASPLSRVLKQAAPGKDWKLGNGHEIEFDYNTNTSSTEVRLYEVTTSKTTSSSVITFEPTLVLNGYYPANSLIKTITYDENHTTGTNHSTEEFKDTKGRVVLKRTYNNSVAHDTYYVYDDFGNLTFVLPPKSEPQSAKPDATELSELCYQYKYDDRNRLVEKKIPGKGWEYIVYNKLDQPIMTQDSNLKNQNKWMFTLYDALGRVAYSGIDLNNSSSRVSLQSAANNASKQYVTKTASANNYSGAIVYYSKDAYPVSFEEVNMVNYYDNYTFDGFSAMPSNIDGQPVINYNNSSGTQKLTKGLATGTKVRVLTTNHWITTYTGYDAKGRAIYVKSSNPYLTTTDVVQSTLDFTGTITKNITTHTRSGVSVTTNDVFTYDHMGRLKKQTQQINSGSTEVIAENTYDDLGQLVTKKVGGKTTQSRLQTIDYTYNIRGSLKQINNPSSLGSDLFAFKINYNTVNHSGTKLYNGNISETEWRTANSDNGLKWYRYGYDALNRITSATANSSNYNVSGIGYDKNGNITALTRQGQTNSAATTFGTMDNLVYTYQTSSNKLIKVLDNGNDTYGFKDGANLTTEYTYDANGNMLTDRNKGITSNIAYNYLNLPTSVSLGGGNISYIYDATGVKLSKTVSTGSTTYYDGNYVYEGSSLKYFNQPEGYVDCENGYKYVYQYKDHLGNIRLSYSDTNGNGSIAASSEIMEENNYYPFGLKHKGYNDNPISSNIALKKKFGGKELNDELGLDWYDFGARNFDASLGRWMNLDPLAEKYIGFSPYLYSGNNPVLIGDIDGKKWKNEKDKEKGEEIKSDAKKSITSSSKNIKKYNEEIATIKSNEKYSDKAKARKIERREDKIRGEKEKITSAKLSIQAINKIGSEDNSTIFTFNRISGDKGYLSSGESGEIVINYIGIGNDLHEAFHAAQYTMGGMQQPTEEGQILNHVPERGLLNEIQAYQAQYSVYPNSMPESSKVIVNPSDIDKSFLKGIKGNPYGLR